MARKQEEKNTCWNTVWETIPFLLSNSRDQAWKTWSRVIRTTRISKAASAALSSCSTAGVSASGAGAKEERWRERAAALTGEEKGHGPAPGAAFSERSRGSHTTGWWRKQKWVAQGPILDSSCLHSMRPSAVRAAFTKTSRGSFYVVQIHVSSGGGLSSSKGAGRLPLGNLIQGKLASGWCSWLSRAAEVSFARSYPGLSSSEEGPTFWSVFWEGKVNNWRQYSEHLAKWRGKKAMASSLDCKKPRCCFEWV